MAPITAAEVSTVVQEIQSTGDVILETVAAVDPGVALPVETAQALVDLFGTMASKALTAWSVASNTPITHESIVALLANATPLSAPDTP